ncbi:MAG: putative lipid II flippase FtsW [Bacillota bacterium]|nr:putative lipid II flippase FtsW [Bacillota bacterium]
MKKAKLFDKVEVDFILLATILLLVAIGVIAVYSASSYIALNGPQHNDKFFLYKQGAAAVLGIIIMLAVEKIDYHKLKRITGLVVIAAVILLIIVLFTPPVNGARRWIQMPFGTLQPSEIAKYTVVLVLAKSIEKRGEKIKYFWSSVFVYLLIGGAFAGLVILEKNLSIASVIMGVTLIMLFVGGAKLAHTVGLVGGIIPVGLLFIILEPYRLQRALNFTNPWKDAKGAGYQLCQSLLALGSGGILGVGLGRSRQKCFYIPEPYNDFIFSIIAEEKGLIGCIVIMILFLIIIHRGIKIAVHAKDAYGTLLAVGITSVIAIQAIINIAVVTGSMPVTGVPLPFISYGGSSLTINLVAMGILLNISSQSNTK